MENGSHVLMLSGVVAHCVDCGDQGWFLPADDTERCEFCCTRCDAAVFLFEVLDNTGIRQHHAA